MPGHRNERADPVDDQRAEQKQQAMAEIGGTRRVAEQASRIDRATPSPSLSYSDTLPPAASMILRAPARDLEARSR